MHQAGLRQCGYGDLAPTPLDELTYGVLTVKVCATEVLAA